MGFRLSISSRSSALLREYVIGWKSNDQTVSRHGFRIDSAPPKIRHAVNSPVGLDNVCGVVDPNRTSRERRGFRFYGKRVTSRWNGAAPKRWATTPDLSDNSRMGCQLCSSGFN